jgi:hypothetical protein
MKPPPSIFICVPHTARRSADLRLAWLDAADDVQNAYAGWLHAELADRGDAFIVYQAALDREEAAARAMELKTHACSDRLRSS